MTNLFKGGVSKVELSTASNFGSIALTITAFSKQGNTWPTPAPVKDPMHDDQELIGGWDCPFAINCLGVQLSDIATLAAAGEAGTRYWARFTSLDGKFVRVVKNFIPHAWPGAVNERGTHGGLRLEGKATGVTASDVYADTYTP